MVQVLAWSVGVVVVVVGVSELATWRVSRRPALSRSTGRCAVVVLGYPSARNGGVHVVQKWRTQIAARTLTSVDDGWLIFSGGVTRGAAESEAAVMARYAESLGVPRDRIQLETESTSTWDNIRCCLPLIDAGGAREIAIASDPFHAEKARRYVGVQRPALAERTVRAANYRFSERWWLKVPTVAYYLRLRAQGSFGQSPPGFVPDTV